MCCTLMDKCCPGPALDLSYLLDYVMMEVKPLNWQAIIDSPIPLKVASKAHRARKRLIARGSLLEEKQPRCRLAYSKVRIAKQADSQSLSLLFLPSHHRHELRRNACQHCCQALRIASQSCRDGAGGCILLEHPPAHPAGGLQERARPEGVPASERDSTGSRGGTRESQGPPVSRRRRVRSHPLQSRHR